MLLKSIAVTGIFVSLGSAEVQLSYTQPTRVFTCTHKPQCPRVFSLAYLGSTCLFGVNLHLHSRVNYRVTFSILSISKIYITISNFTSVCPSAVCTVTLFHVYSSRCLISSLSQLEYPAKPRLPVLSYICPPRCNNRMGIYCIRLPAFHYQV